MRAQTLLEILPREVNFLRYTGRLVNEWSNVFDHCVTEALAAVALSDLVKLRREDQDNLVRAALLHDWNKRNEQEAFHRDGFQAYEVHAEKSAEILRMHGFPPRVIELTQCVGHTALKKVGASKDRLVRMMFYLDVITHGDRIVGVNERMDQLETAARYKDLNESGRAVHGGRTYFEIQRELGNQIESELETKTKVKLVPYIQEKLAK